MRWTLARRFRQAVLFLSILSSVDCGRNLTISGDPGFPRVSGTGRRTAGREVPPPPAPTPAMPYPVPVLPDPYPLPDPFSLLGLASNDAELPGSNPQETAATVRWLYPPQTFSAEMRGVPRSVAVFKKVGSEHEYGYLYGRLVQEIDSTHRPRFIRSELSDQRVAYQTSVRVATTDDAPELLQTVNRGLADATGFHESQIAWSAIPLDGIGFRAFFGGMPEDAIAGAVTTSPRVIAQDPYGSLPFEIKLLGHVETLEPWMQRALEPAPPNSARLRFWSRVWVQTTAWPNPAVPLLCDAAAFNQRIRALQDVFGTHGRIAECVSDARWERGLSVYFISNIQPMLQAADFCRSSDPANNAALRGPRRAEALHRLLTTAWTRVSPTEIRPRSEMTSSQEIDVSHSIRFPLSYELAYIPYVYGGPTQ